MAVNMIVAGSHVGSKTITKHFLGGGTAVKGDLVNIESGELVAASAGDELVGVLLEDMTSSSTDVEVNCTPGLQFIMKNDNDTTTFAASHVGARFDITGASGSQLVDTSTADTTATGRSGQLVCLAYNPQGYGVDSDTTMGLFAIAEAQLLWD